MSKPLIAITAILIIISCNNKNSGGDAKAMETTGKFYVPSAKVKGFVGSYTGTFDEGFITIVINYISGNNVSGYNLHKGLRRNINGLLTEKDSKFIFEMKEPGDNPFDGTFLFTIDPDNYKLSGEWKPFDTVKLKSKQLALTRKAPPAADFSDQLSSTWVPATGTYATDTLLEFKPEGTCEYNFYAAPGDSTSQMLSVKGNYIQEKDTIIIEWQKNEYTPQQKMKLVKVTKKRKGDDYEYEEFMLIGNGWKLTQFAGD